MSAAKWALCVRCTYPIDLLSLQGQATTPLVAEARRFESSVVHLRERIYYCAECGPALRQCRVCGCTDEIACIGGCYWAEVDLCSRCVGVEAPH